MLINREERKIVKEQLRVINDHHTAYMINHYIDILEQDFINSYNNGFIVFNFYTEYKVNYYLSQCLYIIKKRYKANISDLIIDSCKYTDDKKDWHYVVRIVD